MTRAEVFFVFAPLLALVCIMLAFEVARVIHEERRRARKRRESK